jgi:hypothetical protein
MLQADLLEKSARNEIFDQDETRLPGNVTRAKKRVEKDCSGPQPLDVWKWKVLCLRSSHLIK